jgi:hypothetical protein
LKKELESGRIFEPTTKTSPTTYQGHGKRVGVDLVLASLGQKLILRLQSL